MLLRSTASFVVLTLAACHSGPAPGSNGPDPRDQMAQLLMQQMNTHQEQMMSWMTTNRLNDSLVVPNESPGTLELNARIGTLTERLDDLIACLPRPAGPAIDATARRSENGLDKVASDAARIKALTQAVLVIEQVESTCTENIANVNTAGYKKRTVEITTAIEEKSGMQLPKVGRITMLNTTGTLEITERDLDVAIDGEGWFVHTRADGKPCYARSGSLHINADGMIVNGEGCPLSPRITIPNDTLELSIDPEGRVVGRTASNPDQSSRFGLIQLARFRDPGQLRPIEKCVFCATPESGDPIVGTPGTSGLGLLKQGFLERSNVQVTNELMNLQVAQRQHGVLRRLLAGYGVFLR
jgi:flagellar basal-body rod protein FlgG